jgi:hypothetical protein
MLNQYIHILSCKFSSNFDMSSESGSRAIAAGGRGAPSSATANSYHRTSSCYPDMASILRTRTRYSSSSTRSATAPSSHGRYHSRRGARRGPCPPQTTPTWRRALTTCMCAPRRSASIGLAHQCLHGHRGCPSRLLSTRSTFASTLLRSNLLVLSMF